MESKATANLRRNAAKTAEQMRRLVAQAVREAKAAIDAGLKAKAALTAAGRAPIEAQIDVAFRQKLQTKLQEALDVLSSKSADSGNEEAIRQARAKGEIIPRFSPEYLQEYLARISPKNAPALAAVFTQSMSASAKEALRLAAVDTFRAAAATGLTTRERMKLLQENWARRAQDTNPFRFVDRAGRRWENARYVQMLARTTAQRVQTAAFCDSMLQGGYPLARISNDSGTLQCGVCSAWEGRLIDLTAGNLFKKYGAVPLRAAREAGVFHPNCTHRLEYLSPTEYPKGAWDEFADRVGEPGAFGDPLKTNAGAESAAAAKRRAQQAAKAAEERAKREAEEADKTARNLRLIERRAREAEAFGLEPEQYETLRDMVTRAVLFGTLEGEPVDFGKVDELASAKIASVTGIDVKSFRVTVTDEDIRHARNRHGKRHFFKSKKDATRYTIVGEKTKSQKELAPHDYLSILKDIQGCENVTLGTNENRTGDLSIRVLTKDGTVERTTVAIVDKKLNVIRFKTMWKKTP